MPNAGTLDTLRIEIEANAQKASDGVGSLVGSLRSLAKGVGTVVPALRALNNELKHLQKFQGMKLPGLSQALKQMNSSNTAKAAKAATVSASEAIEFAEKKSKLDILRLKQSGTVSDLGKEIWKGSKAKEYRLGTLSERYKKLEKAIEDEMNPPPEADPWRGQPRKPLTITNNTGAGNMLSEEESRKAHPEWYRDFSETLKQSQAYYASRSGPTEAQKDAIRATEQFKAIAAVQEKTKHPTTENILGAYAKGAEEAERKIRGVGKAIEETQEKAQTVAPAIKQASASTKEISKTAEESVPKMSKLSHVLSRIGRIASTMIIRAGLKSLMKAFSESWEAAYAFSNKMGGSFAKSIDQARTMLADTATTVIQTVAPVFQALIPVINVIATTIQFLCQQIQNLLNLLGLSSDLFGANTQAINKNIGASNKNASSKKNLLASWDELNVIQSQGGGSGGGSGYKPGSMKDLVQSELAGVTSVLVGEALLAVGLILAFTGHPAIGIALAALGATAIVRPIVEGWGKMSEKVKREITNITLIAGASMLALGTILLLSGAGTGLGVAMLIAGGLNLVAAVALNWDSIVGKVSSIFNKIEEVAVNVWNNISTAISDAWEAVSTWFDENIVQNVSAAWNTVFDFFATLFGGTDVDGSIANYALSGWEWIKSTWTENILPLLSGAWDGIVSWFTTLFGGSDVDGSIANYALSGWEWIKSIWSENILPLLSGAWDGIVSWFSTLFGGSDVDGSIANYALSGWEWVKSVWTENILAPIQTAWNNVLAYFTELWGDSETGICGEFSALWAEISCLWGDIMAPVKKAWAGISNWFKENVTDKISSAFKSAMNVIIGFINGAIDGLNALGNFTIPGWSATMPDWLGGGTFGWQSQSVSLFNIGHIPELAEGGFVPQGDLFIANEAGAELVGSMNGKTTVANQWQIIEGIQRGVRDANQEQNDLLRRQNDLLMNLLEKSGTITVEPSAAWGRFNQRSAEMWGRTTGR